MDGWACFPVVRGRQWGQLDDRATAANVECWREVNYSRLPKVKSDHILMS